MDKEAHSVRGLLQKKSPSKRDGKELNESCRKFQKTESGDGAPVSEAIVTGWTLIEPVNYTPSYFQSLPHSNNALQETEKELQMETKSSVYVDDSEKCCRGSIVCVPASCDSSTDSESSTQSESDDFYQDDNEDEDYSDDFYDDEGDSDDEDDSDEDYNDEDEDSSEIVMDKIQGVKHRQSAPEKADKK